MQLKKTFKFFVFLSMFLMFCAFNDPGCCVPADVEPITNQYYLPRIIELIEGAETSIKVIMYNITWYKKYPDSPSNKLIELLCNAAKKKIDVTIILDKDKTKDTNEGNKEAAIILKKAGVKVLFDSPEQTTHAKLLIVDKRFVVVGSFNWSYNSLEKNNETAVVIDSKEIAEYFLKYFNNIAIRSSSFSVAD